MDAGVAARGRLRRRRSSPMQPASPSSRRLVSNPAALATPPHTILSATCSLFAGARNRWFNESMSPDPGPPDRLYAASVFREEAEREGFARVGFAQIEEPSHFDRFRDWI